MLVISFGQKGTGKGMTTAEVKHEGDLVANIDSFVYDSTAGLTVTVQLARAIVISKGKPCHQQEESIFVQMVPWKIRTYTKTGSN